MRVILENRWTSLAGKGYSVEDLGRPAVFLIPLSKLGKLIGAVTIENELHEFLVNNFGGYRIPGGSSHGFYKSREKTIIFDECREYEVSFLGKERIPILLKKLAEIAAAMEEECIYMKAGQYAGLVYPERPPY